jgi:hypothetical protein
MYVIAVPAAVICRGLLGPVDGVRGCGSSSGFSSGQLVRDVVGGEELRDTDGAPAIPLRVLPGLHVGAERADGLGPRTHLPDDQYPAHVLLTFRSSGTVPGGQSALA